MVGITPGPASVSHQQESPMRLHLVSCAQDSVFGGTLSDLPVQLFEVVVWVAVLAVEGYSSVCDVFPLTSHYFKGSVRVEKQSSLTEERFRIGSPLAVSLRFVFVNQAGSKTVEKGAIECSNMFGRNTSSHLVGQKEKVAFGCPHKYLVRGAPFGAHPPNGSLMGTPCTDTLKDSFSYQLDHHLYSWKISSFWRRLQFTSIAIMLHSFAICIFSRILMHLPDYAFMQPLFGIEFYGSAATITIQASANRWDFVKKQCKSNHLQNKTVQHDLLHCFDLKS